MLNLFGAVYNFSGFTVTRQFAGLSSE